VKSFELLKDKISGVWRTLTAEELEEAQDTTPPNRAMRRAYVHQQKVERRPPRHGRKPLRRK
jgi:hypothetical protein